jgi:hypothetical protein
MTFRVLLTRQQVEALAARAIKEEKNLEKAAATQGKLENAHRSPSVPEEISSYA